MKVQVRSEKIKLFFAPNLPLPELIGATRGFGLLVNSPALLLHPGLQPLQPSVLENKFLNNVFVVGKQFLEILVSDPICKTYAGVNWLKVFQLSQSFKNSLGPRLTLLPPLVRDLRFPDLGLMLMAGTTGNVAHWALCHEGDCVRVRDREYEDVQWRSLCN